MNSQEFERKLSAILSADVVEYSRLMGENEESTVKTLEDYKGLMFTLINEHRGRVVDSTGDNFLAEFGISKHSSCISWFSCLSNLTALYSWL